jgi:hypothetical protein
VVDEFVARVRKDFQEDVPGDAGQPADEQPSVQDEGAKYQAYVYNERLVESFLVSLELWAQLGPDELASGLRAAGKVREAQASLDKVLAVLLELQDLLKRRGG